MALRTQLIHQPRIDSACSSAAVQVNVDLSLCTFCQKAVYDVLSSIETFRLGWEPNVRLKDGGKPTKEMKLSKHHDGQLKSLFASGRNGCKMCDVFAKYIAERFPSPVGDSMFPPSIRYRVVSELSYDKTNLRLEIKAPEGYNRVSDEWKMLNYDFYLRRQENPHWRGRGVQRPVKADWPVLPTRLNSYSGSNEVLQLALDWVSDCLWNHPNCRRPLQRLPKRVLVIGGSVAPGWIRLRETKGECEHYAALSYSWGKALPLKTLRSNIESHYNGIAITTLPKTLQDAIAIASQLGLHLLWIDALCIVQDDEQDWAEQAAQMVNVFYLSSLTISATSSVDCESGIFAQTAAYGTNVGSISIPGEKGDDRQIHFDRIRTGFTLEDKHLFTRGWTFQEHLVPHTILYFTDDGIAWECPSATITERSPPGAESSLFQAHSFRFLQQLPGNLNPWGPNYVSPEAWDEAFRNWYYWTQLVTERTLTRVDDKLPAMAGVASYFSKKLNANYVAGLWKEDLIEGMLWERGDLALALERHKDVAPSWSWASVTGQIGYSSRIKKLDAPNTKHDLTILNVHVEEIHPGTFGQVRNGRIEAKGWLQEVTVARLVSNQILEESYITAGMLPGIFATCRLDEVVYQFDAEDHVPPLHCWAVRVSAGEPAGAQTHTILLLLEKVSGDEAGERLYFRRTGLATTKTKEGELSDESEEIFECPTYQQFLLL